MIFYWSLMLLPLAAGVSPWKANHDLKIMQWILYTFILIIIIGLRNNVGGDWGQYVNAYTPLIGIPISEVFENPISKNYGYEILQWISFNYTGYIYFSNLVCAVIFVAGLIRLVRTTAMPWLALVIATSYLVIVVSTGYTRQATAIGFFMWALVDLRQGRLYRFYIYIILGSLFHTTLLIMLLLGFFYNNTLKKGFIYFGFAIILYVYFLQDLINTSLAQSDLEIVTQMQGDFISKIKHFFLIPHAKSYGSLMRNMLNVFSAFVFISFYRKWNLRYPDGRLMMIFSITSILLLFLSFSFSAAADRLALYLIPMQIIILVNVIPLITLKNFRTWFVLFILIIYASTLLIWQNFGVHSVYWHPYKNILTSDVLNSPPEEHWNLIFKSTEKHEYDFFHIDKSF